MEFDFWSDAWSAGRIGFHQAQVHVGLQQRWPDLFQAGAPARVLVPLCGKSLDLLWLQKRGSEVVGVEFVRQAVLELGDENGLGLGEHRRGKHSVLSAAGLQLWVADFFEVGPEQLGQFEAVFDRAALVAVEPARRAQYAQAIGRLVRPGGQVLLATLEHDMDGGPPHSVTADQAEELFSAEFEVERLAETDLLPAEPRFRERGATRFVEHLLSLRRKEAPQAPR